MSIQLTPEQQQELNTRQEYPPRVLNPHTNETFVLIPAEMFERVRAILEEQDDIAAIRETYSLTCAVLETEDRGNTSKESA